MSGVILQAFVDRVLNPCNPACFNLEKTFGRIWDYFVFVCEWKCKKRKEGLHYIRNDSHIGHMLIFLCIQCNFLIYTIIANCIILWFLFCSKESKIQAIEAKLRLMESTNYTDDSGSSRRKHPLLEESERNKMKPYTYKTHSRLKNTDRKNIKRPR